MKIIKVSVYLQHNAGDDIMLEQLVERYPNYWFYGCIPGQQKTKKLKKMRYFDITDIIEKTKRINKIANILTFYKRKDFLRRLVVRYVEKRCVQAVAIGGAIYRPVVGETIEERIKREKNKHLKTGELYVIGANFGPYDSEEFYQAFYKYFSECSGVSFRDSYSYSLFNTIKHIQWAPDVVFGVKSQTIKQQDIAVISIIDLANRPHLKEVKGDYENFIVGMVRVLIERGLTPVLTSFCAYEGDELAIERIFNSLSCVEKEKTEFFYYNGDTARLLALFESAKFVVATRFHSMVLGMRFSKPLFSISYELKMQNVLMDTGSSAWCDIKEIASMCPKQAFELGGTIVDCTSLIQKANMQFAQLDKELKGS